MSDLQELLDDFDIQDWLAENGVEFRIRPGSRGAQINIKECPVCGNAGWKVYLNSDTGHGNCFAGSHPADRNFSKYLFVKEWTGLKGREVYQHIERFVEEGELFSRDTEKKELPKLEAPLDLPPHVMQPDDDGIVLAYLRERGISSEICRRYDLRFVEKGAYRYTFDGEDKEMSFDQRVLIPVYDHTGAMKTFQGRDITGTAQQKYLFPPGLAGSGSFLYGANLAMGKPTLLLVEGVFDVMSADHALRLAGAHEIGVAGSFGISVSMSESEPLFDDQLGVFYALRKAGLRRVIFMWDNEAKAQERAQIYAQKLKGFGVDCLATKLDSGKDANEANPTEIMRAVRAAKPVSGASLLMSKLLARAS